MTEPSAKHAEITARLRMWLGTALDPERFAVSSFDPGVPTERSIRHPDVLVDAQGSDRAANLAAAPVLIAEVTEPQTYATDFGSKVVEYTSLPSLAAYLVLFRNEPRAWIWRRTAEGTFPEEPEMLVGREATIPLPGLGLTLALSDIYPGEETDAFPA
ncbi:Uma2 family endonuclease [Blastochloris sulfoviridis]|uniref:Uma2 family endonuclease n=2 Tax=Blastochloris sulfoviridis TaxID=50712 RepID=A0A5M6I1V6_9HYPH|nr:Uma2 family endonuclease [Blastochloris sulfoviridis]